MASDKVKIYESSPGVDGFNRLCGGTIIARGKTAGTEEERDETTVDNALVPDLVFARLRQWIMCSSRRAISAVGRRVLDQANSAANKPYALPA